MNTPEVNKPLPEIYLRGNVQYLIEDAGLHEESGLALRRFRVSRDGNAFSMSVGVTSEACVATGISPKAESSDLWKLAWLRIRLELERGVEIDGARFVIQSKSEVDAIGGLPLDAQALLILWQKARRQGYALSTFKEIEERIICRTQDLMLALQSLEGKGIVKLHRVIATFNPIAHADLTPFGMQFTDQNLGAFKQRMLQALPAAKNLSKFASLLDSLKRDGERCRNGLLKMDELKQARESADKELDGILEHDSDLWREKDILRKKTRWITSTATGYADSRDAGQLDEWSAFVSRCANALGAPVPGSATLSNQPFQALKTMHSFIKQAAAEILIVDNYLKEDIFDLLDQDSIPKHIRLRMLTKEPTKAFKAYLVAFVAERGNIEVRIADDIHDRYIVIDGQQALHCGASIKGAGMKLSRISRLENSQEREGTIGKIEDAWRRSRSI